MITAPKLIEMLLRLEHDPKDPLPIVAVIAGKNVRLTEMTPERLHKIAHFLNALYVEKDQLSDYNVYSEFED